jgi:N-acylethanolamine-hydrolysing acid amidase
MFRNLILATTTVGALAGSFLEVTEQGCPVCEGKSPTVWPFSGCDVRCGAKSEGICCCIPGVGGCGVAREKIPLPKVVINLDLEPEERFAALAASHKTYYDALAQVLKVMFKGQKYDDFLDAVVIPDETKRELQGIADAMGVPLKTVLLGEFYYELDALSDVEERQSWPAEFQGGAGCTGIIAQGSDGTVYHGRNQDYPPPFTPLQYDAEFQKGGKTIYEATNFAGIASIGGTCMVSGSFSVEINARSTEGVPLDTFMADAAAGKPISANLVRQACARGGDFESAVKFLSETPALGAAAYMIVAGAKAGEGAVISRNATGIDSDVQRLSQGYPADAPWYLLQDNYDHWDNTTHKAPITPGIFGDDLRRVSGHQIMAQLSPAKFGVEEMWQVMSDNGDSTIGSNNWGIFNFATIHTEVIVPATGEYHSYEGHQVVADSEVV